MGGLSTSWRRRRIYIDIQSELGAFVALVLNTMSEDGGDIFGRWKCGASAGAL